MKHARTGKNCINNEYLLMENREYSLIGETYVPIQNYQKI